MKTVTANENEAISAYVQLQMHRQLPPRFCTYNSVEIGSNERVVEIHVNISRSGYERMNVFLWWDGNKHWRVWKIISQRVLRGPFVHQSFQAWVARTLGMESYEFAEAPVDTHIDANHDYWFNLASA